MSPCLVMNIHKYELIYLYEHCRPFDTKLETLIQSYICYGILVCFLFYVPPHHTFLHLKRLTIHF